MRVGLIVLFVAMLALGVRADASDLDRALAMRDYSLARSLAESGAKKGDAHSQYVFGQMLVNGNGGPQDVNAGVVWLEKSGRQKNTDALGLLGFLHFSKMIEGHSLAKAWMYTRLARSLGNDKAVLPLFEIEAIISDEDFALGRVLIRKWREDAGIPHPDESSGRN